MSVISYLHRFVVYNLLTVYYNLQMLLLFVIAYLSNPFKNPWAQKLKLEPPSRLTDPKYGVHKSLKANNVVLHYVESGNPDKPMMLFVHGFPEFWYSWRHQIVEFQKDYWCIAVDMRGYGDSERPEGVSSYKLEVLVEDIRELIRQLGREKCIIISHDWGGLIASRFRDLYPDMVLAVILLSSISLKSINYEIWNNPIQRKKSWYIFLYRAPYIPEMVLAMYDLKFYDDVMLFPDNKTTDKEDIECYKYWFRKPYALTPPINYYRANFLLTQPEIIQHEENVPMLLAHAEKDLYLSTSLLDTVKKEYKHVETTIVKGVGHFLQQEDPEKVNKVIKEFLAKHKL